MMMKDVQHIQCYPELQNAFKGSRMNFKLYMIHQVPPTIMAMSRDWDLTFAHPFLKRLCHELEVEVVCGKGSGREDDADLVLSLTGSTWTKGSTLEPIPICPVFVRSGTHQDTTNRVKKWLADHFTCLEQNKFVYQDYECPVPYFVLESSWWTVGVGVKGRRGLELYEECLRSIKWDAGVQRVTLVLGYIIGSTAEYYREWYREHGPDRQTLEEG